MQEASADALDSRSCRRPPVIVDKSLKLDKPQSCYHEAIPENFSLNPKSFAQFFCKSYARSAPAETKKLQILRDTVNQQDQYYGNSHSCF